MDLTVFHTASVASGALAFLLPAVDAVLPAVPSETAIIALGVGTAGSSDPRLVAVVALAAAGAFVGDNLGYLIGRRFQAWADRRLFSGERGARRRLWAVRNLERYGAMLIVSCRFIPAGRTAVTLACGMTGYPRRRFAAATAAAAVLWASYAFLLGRLGGKAFADRPWAGLLMALGVSVAFSGLIELARRARRRRRAAEPPARALTTAP